MLLKQRGNPQRKMRKSEFEINSEKAPKNCRTCLWQTRPVPSTINLIYCKGGYIMYTKVLLQCT